MTGLAMVSFRTPQITIPALSGPTLLKSANLVHAEAQDQDQMSGRLTALVVTLVATTMLTTACARGGARVCGSPSNSPDPHDRQLHELAADPVFAASPVGIRYRSTTHIPATWHQGVDGAAWKGASVSAWFTTTLQRPVLDRVFDQFVEQAGWRLDRYGNRPPDTQQWIKRLPDGAQVTLDLWQTTAATNDYALSGNITVPCH
jgi:hypothetical protein